MNHTNFPREAGYCHIYPFNLNSSEHTVIGEPDSMPADSFLISYFLKGVCRRILIDTGKKGQGSEIMIPYLKRHGIDTIDLVFISHMHRDHYGGLIDLLNDPHLTIKQIMYAPMPQEVIRRKAPDNFATWQEFDTLLNKHREIVTVISDMEPGYRIPVADNFFFEIVATPNMSKIEQHWSQVGLNDLNLVLKLHFRKFTALFPGDCCIEQAEEIMQSPGRHMIEDVVLLKAAHHAKGESLSPEMIAKCRARVVIIPCNKEVTENKEAFMPNLYAYSQNGAKVFRMDQYKDIQVYTDGRTVECIGQTNSFSEKTYFKID